MPTVTTNARDSSVPSAASISERIYIVADDLTGACDSAAAFLRDGRTVRVWLGAAASFSAPEPVQAFNTDSRSFSPARASRTVARTAATLASDLKALCFKKVDSAARGPFAAEILAAHRAFQSRAVLLAPAFPGAGRTVRNGILEIQDVTGQLTHIDVAGLFSPRNRSLIHLVSRPEELPSAFNSGKPVLLCDSSTQSDLESLVCAAENLRGLLFAGSAGLAQAIASRNEGHIRPVPPPFASRTLIVAGSDHPVTRLQLATLGRTPDPALKVLRLYHKSSDRTRILQAFRSFAPQAMILTGGDTALLAASTFGAHSFILKGELAPGIPWGIVQGGMAEGCFVITKSGGFGTPTIFNEILATLRGPA
jgi:uncharacterized protein YgbK (DUF1537 family)